MIDIEAIKDNIHKLKQSDFERLKAAIDEEDETRKEKQHHEKDN